MRAFHGVLLVVAAIACAPADRDVRIDRLRAERQNLEATFDRLEDRLVVNGARVRFWREMRDRHESVSAIACASLDEHAEEMALHQARSAPAHSSLHRSRVAAAAPVERGPAAESASP